MTAREKAAYLHQIESENRVLDQELARLHVQVPDSDSLRYSSLTPGLGSLPAHHCAHQAPGGHPKSHSDSLKYRVHGVEKAVFDLKNRLIRSDELIDSLEIAIFEKQKMINELEIRKNPQVFQPSVIAKTNLTQITRKKQQFLEEKIKSQAEILQENKKTMHRFQQLNHDLLYRAREKLEEEQNLALELKSDLEIQQKIKNLSRDKEIIMEKNASLREEIENRRKELEILSEKRVELEGELSRFETSTKTLHLANQSLRENLIKLLNTV